MEPEKKAAHLLLHIPDIARKVCLPYGRHVIDNLGGAAQISRIPRERFAPDGIDSILQDMAECMYMKRAGQNMATYIMEFGTLREKAESRMLTGSGPPDASASVLCMQDAALPRNEGRLCRQNRVSGKFG